jgi:exopolysaccharide biosynthesis polyprenyl glycosylphosphotransferase
MNLDRRHVLMRCLELFDLSVLSVAIGLGAFAYVERMHFNLREALELRFKVSNFAVVVAFLAICHVILRSHGLYESRRLSTKGAEVRDILLSVTMCVLVLGGAAVAFKAQLFSTRSFFATFWVSSAGMLIASRVLLRAMLAQLRRRGRNLRQVLIVGTNCRAAQLAVKVERKPELGYRLIGFADDPWLGLRAVKALGFPIRTDLKHLSEFLRDTVIDEVFICLPLKSQYERIREIIERCESQGIIVRLLGRIFDLRVAHSTAETFEDETVVSVYTGQMDGWQFVAKRAFDVIGSIVLLTVLSPVFLVTILAVKFTSSGPVFFVQERVGINKRRFRVLKFRTMVMEAEARQASLESLNEVSGPVFKIKNDPRITSVGRFLRKTSIDELPQLINVLKGDMSLVGPRPLPVRDYNGFDKDWHRRRFSVRPGITCLWQVNGRSRLPFEKWMELDMEYIDQWSFWLDLKILIRTVPAVLRGSGAA